MERSRERVRERERMSITKCNWPNKEILLGATTHSMPFCDAETLWAMKFTQSLSGNILMNFYDWRWLRKKCFARICLRIKIGRSVSKNFVCLSNSIFKTKFRTSDEIGWEFCYHVVLLIGGCVYEDGVYVCSSFELITV